MPETKIQIASLADVITLTKNSFNEFFNLVGSPEFTEEDIIFDNGYRELIYLASINLPEKNIYPAETEGIFEEIKWKAPEISAVTEKTPVKSFLDYHFKRKPDQYRILAFTGRSATLFLAKTPALDHDELAYEYVELSKIGLPHYKQ